MKNIALSLLLALFSIGVYAQPPNRGNQRKVDQPKGYQIGDQAEDFELMNVDGSMQSLSKIENAKGYIVIFTSNECPFAIAYEDRIIELHNEMAPNGYPVVAINSNDGAEGGGNTMQDMITRYDDKNFPFVYLKDEKQAVFPKFGATKTPHVFLLDKNMVIQYIGAIDDNSNSPADVQEKYVEQAIAALEMGKSPEPAMTKAIGCPIASKGGRGAQGRGDQAQAGQQRPGRQGRKGPPSPDQIIEMMDKNNDQQVSKSEVHGPLERDFDNLDADNNGLLSKEELSKIRKTRQ